MFVLMFWILIIECMTVEIKVVYGTDRVIITIPVHVKKMHHTRTVYKIVEKPVAAGLRTNRRPQTTAPGAGPDGGRPHGWYDGGGGGGGETAQGADATDSHGARRRPPSHDDRGNAAAAAATTGDRDRGHRAAASTSSRGADVAPGGGRGRGDRTYAYRPYAHKPRVVHVVGRHKHGHYADVMYTGHHGPRHLRGPPKHAYPVARHRPAGHGTRKPPWRGAPQTVPGPGHGGRAVPIRFRPAAPVVVPPPPLPPPHHHHHQHHQHHDDDDEQDAVRDDDGGGGGGGGYQVQEDVVDIDDRPSQRPPTTPDPLPYITHSPAAAVTAQQHSIAAAVSPQHQAALGPQQAAFASQQTAFASQQAAFASPQTAVSHVYYTLDPVVPYDDVARPSTRH